MLVLANLKKRVENTSIWSDKKLKRTELNPVFRAVFRFRTFKFSSDLVKEAVQK